MSSNALSCHSQAIAYQHGPLYSRYELEAKCHLQSPDRIPDRQLTRYTDADISLYAIGLHLLPALIQPPALQAGAKKQSRLVVELVTLKDQHRSLQKSTLFYTHHLLETAWENKVARQVNPDKHSS